MSCDFVTRIPSAEEKSAEYLLQNPFNLEILRGTEELQKQLNVLFMNQNNEVCDILQQIDNLENEDNTEEEEQIQSFSYSSYPINTLEHPYEYNASVQVIPSENLDYTDFGKITSICDESKEEKQIKDAKKLIKNYESQLMFLKDQNTKLLDNHPIEINVSTETSIQQAYKDNLNLKQLLIETEKISKTNNTSVKDRLLSLLHLKSQQKIDLLSKIQNLIYEISMSYDNNKDDEYKENSQNIDQKLSLFQYYKLEYDNEIKQLDKEINELKKELDFYIKLDCNNNNNITENDIKKHIQQFYDRINTYLIKIENDCDYIINNHENKHKQQQLQYINKIKSRSKSAPKTKNRSNSLTPISPSTTTSTIFNNNIVSKSTLLIEKDISNNIHKSITYLRGEIHKQIEVLKKECHNYLFSKTMEMEQRIKSINNEKIKLQASNIIETERKQKLVNEKLVNLKKTFYKKYKDEVIKQINRLESEQNTYRNCINNILENKNNSNSIEQLSSLYNQQQKRYDMIRNRLELKEELDKSYKLQYDDSNKEFEKCIYQQNLKIKELEKSYQNTIKSSSNNNYTSVCDDIYKYEGKNDEILNVINYYEKRMKNMELFYSQKCDKLIKMLGNEGVKVDKSTFMGKYNSNVSKTQKSHQPVIFQPKSRSNSNLKKHGLITKPIKLV